MKISRNKIYKQKEIFESDNLWYNILEVINRTTQEYQRMKKIFLTLKSKEKVISDLIEIQDKINKNEIVCPNIKITNEHEIRCINGRSTSYWSCDIEKEGTLELRRRFRLMDGIESIILGIIYLICIYLICRSGVTWIGFSLLCVIGMIEVGFLYLVEYFLPGKTVAEFVKKYII